LNNAVTGDGDRALEFTQRLLEAGADPGFTPPSPPAGYLTPFQWALVHAESCVAAYLLDQFEHLLDKVTLDGLPWTSFVSKSNLPMVMAVMAAQTARAVEAAVDYRSGDPSKPLATQGFGSL
jgi:hypothetical protein